MVTVSEPPEGSSDSWASKGSGTYGTKTEFQSARYEVLCSLGLDRRTKAAKCKESVDHEGVESLNEQHEQSVRGLVRVTLVKGSYEYGFERVGFERAEVEGSRG